MKDCSFCKKIKWELPSIKLFENKYVVAFAPLKKVIIGKGHMLLVPKKHFESIYDIDEFYLCELFKAVKEISIKLKDIGADGINILHASGKSGQQSVSHFHLHLIPRFKDDGLDTWPKTGYKETNFLDCYKEFCFNQQ